MSEVDNLYDKARMAERNLAETRTAPKQQSKLLSGGRPDPICKSLTMHEVKDAYSGTRMFEFSAADGRASHWMEPFKTAGKRQIAIRNEIDSPATGYDGAAAFRQRVARMQKQQRAYALVAAGKLDPSLLGDFINGD